MLMKLMKLPIQSGNHSSTSAFL